MLMNSAEEMRQSSILWLMITLGNTVGVLFRLGPRHKMSPPSSRRQALKCLSESKSICFSNRVST
jgi:hypothetical protein